MLKEIPFVPRDIEDPVQEIAFTELPWMLQTVQIWIDERPTMGSVMNAIKQGLYKRSEKHGYKMDFGVNFNYLRQAVEEGYEFAKANPSEKYGELGDVLFLLLHFANGAGILADDVVMYLNEDILSDCLKSKLPLYSRVVNSIFQKSSIPSVVKWYKENIGGDNIELLGAMSGDEAPWTLDRNSREWCDYQQSVISRWSLVFGAICQYSIRNNISLLEIIYQTTTKASYNFPIPFFKPESSPFFSGPTSNTREISCCRLFRKLKVEPGGFSFIDQYHERFDGQNVASNPSLFRQWVHESLLSILRRSPQDDIKSTAYWLLRDFKWESLE